jgi:hypothetical protein
MVVSKSRFYLSLLTLSLFLFFFTLLFSDILIGWGKQLYTNYDSVVFFENRLLDINTILYDNSYNYIAYKLYPVYLSIVNSLFDLFVDNVSYQLMIFSNFFLYGIFLLYYNKVIGSVRVPAYVLFFIVLEPSIIAFSLTLEREVFTSIILGLFTINFLYTKNKFIKFIFSIVFLFLLFNLRFEIAVLVIASYLLYKYISFFILNKKFLYNLIATSILLIPILVFTIYLNDILQIYLRHIAGINESGFGSVIANLPVVLRIGFYSLLYFIMPISIFSDKSYLFEYFMVFSGLTYSFFWAFIILNYKNINSKLLYIFIVLLLLHIGLGGTLFNIRHRVDIVIPLIVLFLALSQIITGEYGYFYLKKKLRDAFLISFSLVVGLIIVYYISDITI